MQIILLDRQEKRIADLHYSLVIDPIEIDDLYGDSRFIFSYPARETDARDLKRGNKIAITDILGNWQLYEIRYDELEIGDAQEIIRIEAENIYNELRLKTLRTLTVSSATPTSAINVAIAGTGWEVGTVTAGGTRTFDAGDLSPYDALRFIANRYQGELQFRVTVSGSGINKRYVDLLDSRGEFRGKAFEIGYDMAGITINTDQDDIRTALYGWGQGEAIADDIDTEEGGGQAERLDFSEIEWIKGENAELTPGGATSPAPVNKPLGQKWIGEELYRDIFGIYNPDEGAFEHRYGEYESQAQSPEALIWETWRQVERQREPKVNVKSDVRSLQQIDGFIHERTDVGDTCYLKVPFSNFETDTETISVTQGLQTWETVDDQTMKALAEATKINTILARILKIERHRKRPDNTRIEFGNYRPAIGGTLADLAQWRDRTSGRAGVWDRGKHFGPGGEIATSQLDGIIDAVNNQIKAGGGTVWMDGDGWWVFDTDTTPLDATAAIRGVAHAGDAALVLGTRTLSTDAWDWRVGMTTDGFRVFGEEIISGKILTDQVIIEGEENLFYWDAGSLYAIDPGNPLIYWRFDKDGLRHTVDGGANWVHRFGQDKIEIGTDAEFSGSIKVGATIGSTGAGTVESDSADGKSAKTKIDTDVGADTIESTTGAQAKADGAETGANSYTDAEAAAARDAARDNLAQQLGYTDYANMVTTAQIGGSTLIVGGYLETDLIQVGSLIAEHIGTGTLDATNVMISGFAEPSTGNAMTHYSITKWDQLPAGTDTMQKVIDGTDLYTHIFSWDANGLLARDPLYQEQQYWNYNHQGLRYTKNNGSSWIHQLLSDGTLSLGGGAFLWDGSTLTITGAINVTGGNLGDMAFEDLVQVAKLGTTIIDGGYIRTTLIEVGAINITGLNGAATFTAYDTTNVDGVAAGTVKNNSATGANHANNVAHAPDDATKGADWNNNLNNIPGTLGTPSGTGLFLSPTYMGFYTGGAWKTFIKNDGKFAFDGDGDNYVSWDGIKLEIAGELQAVTGTFEDLKAGRTSGTAAQINYMHLHENSDNPFLDFYAEDTKRLSMEKDKISFYDADEVFVGRIKTTTINYELFSSRALIIHTDPSPGADWHRLLLWAGDANKLTRIEMDEDLLLMRGGSGGGLRMNDAKVQTEYKPLYVSTHNTTANAANCVIDSGDGQIRRSTSAKKYKTDIEALDLNCAAKFLNDCSPVFYRSLCETDRKDWSYYGYIADDVAKIEPRLVEFSEGEPEGFAYDRVAALLHVIIKDQQARIEKLEKQVF